MAGDATDVCSHDGEECEASAKNAGLTQHYKRASSLLEMPALFAPGFTVRRAGPGERDASRLCHFTGEEGDDQDAVAIGNIGVFPFNSIGAGVFTVVTSHAPSFG